MFPHSPVRSPLCPMQQSEGGACGHEPGSEETHAREGPQHEQAGGHQRASNEVSHPEDPEA